jgi:hypothetical protein
VKKKKKKKKRKEEEEEEEEEGAVSRGDNFIFAWVLEESRAGLG